MRVLFITDPERGRSELQELLDKGWEIGTISPWPSALVVTVWLPVWARERLQH